MNTLACLIENVGDANRIVLEKNKTYNVFPEDGFIFNGLFCSNTAFEKENPDGQRFTAIYIKNKNNLTIDGNGATVVVHGIMTPVIFSKVRNITLKNLKIEYYRPTMSEFKVIHSEKGKIRISIPKDCPYEIKDNKLFWVGEKDKNGQEYFRYPYKGDNILSQVYDAGIKQLKMLDRENGDKMPSFPTIKTIHKVTEGTLDIEFVNKTVEFPKGSIFQTRDVSRKQIGGIFDECVNLKISDVEINSMNGMGLVFQNSKNIFLEKVKCVPKAGKTICSNADFFHFSGCEGKITIKNCTAIGAHDDVINVHGTHLRIIEKNEQEKSIVVKFCNGASWGFNVYNKGDKIDFIKGQTLIPYSRNKVNRVENLDKYTVKLFLNKDLPKIDLNVDVIENITRTAKLIVKDNYFERVPSRAILCTTRKKTIIKRNVFRNMGGPVLYVADDCNFWYESGKSGTVKFLNNIVDSCDFGFIGTGENIIQYEPIVIDKNSNKAVHKKLIVKGNCFKGSLNDNYRIKLEYLNKAIVKSNCFDKPYIVDKDKTITLRDKNNIIQKGEKQ